MLTKLRSWSQPELGEKDRIIFNNSHKNGGKISLNEGISDENRRMGYPPILQTINIKVNRAFDLYGECSIACFDVENGFENLFNNPTEQPLLGVYIHGKHYTSIVGEYGEASKPKQMHSLLIILIELIEIVLKHKYGIELDIMESTIKYMDDGGIFNGSIERTNKILDWIVKIAWKEFGIKMKKSKIVRATKHIDKFLGFEIFTDINEHKEPLIQVSKDRRAKLKERGRILCTKEKYEFITLYKWQGCAFSVSEVRWPLKSMVRAVTRKITKELKKGTRYHQVIEYDPLVANTVNTFNECVLKLGPMPLKDYSDIKNYYK